MGGRFDAINSTGNEKNSNTYDEEPAPTFEPRSAAEEAAAQKKMIDTYSSLASARQTYCAVFPYRAQHVGLFCTRILQHVSVH